MNIQLLNELENILTDILNQTRNTGHSARQNAHQYPHSYSPQPHVYMSPHNIFQGHPRLDYSEISNHTLYKIQQATNILTKLLDVPGTPVVNVDLEIRKIQERLDKLEMPPKPVQVFTWDELQAANRQQETAGYRKPPAGNNPWEYVYHKFTNMLNWQAGSVLMLIMEKSQAAQPVKTELKSMLSYIATEGRQQTAIASLTSFVYIEALTGPGVYQYNDDQHVVITPIHNGKVYIVIFNPKSNVIYDMYLVDGIDRKGRHNVVPIHDMDVLYEIYDTPTPAPAPAPKTDVVVEEKQERVLYPNLMDIQGMRERIVEMRKGITKITLPKIALRPVIEAIGNHNWVASDIEPLVITPEEYELLTDGIAVYSVPCSRTRVVVVMKDGKTRLMTYASDTYTIHDIYCLTYDEFHDEYLVTQTENHAEDLLFVFSLGEQG